MESVGVNERADEVADCVISERLNRLLNKDLLHVFFQTQSAESRYLHRWRQLLPEIGHFVRHPVSAVYNYWHSQQPHDELLRNFFGW